MQSTVPGGIRNISQTVQEREIVKTAPDVVVFIDGLPYLVNAFVADSRTGADSTLVNFNDHMTTFSANYDTESLVPECSIQLQVPNFQKYLYQMPGGNNLLQTMAQIQVYAKCYYMAAGTGDTVYRRVFKGVTSHIGYNDNGKTLEISIQCHGIMYMMEKMMSNIHPSTASAYHTGMQQTIWESVYADGNCFEVLAAVFLDALHSDGFQITNLISPNAGGNSDPFWDAINRGYIVKWQAILNNLVKDVHIYSPYKDSLADHIRMKKDPNWGTQDKDKASAGVAKRSTEKESNLAQQYSAYYGEIAKYYPFRNITALDLKNSVIVNRLDIIREVSAKMDFEAYQDMDGKIIIKPPLYNLDVLNLGPRTKQTSTQLNSSHNSVDNPATTIYETNNPFVVYLSEMLTEQETEDQSAIRRTRTTVCGNISREIGVAYDNVMATEIGEYIDVPKLAKFGLREEPLITVPWIGMGQKYTLFAHAAAETARANRGYRTYTFTIPMRPELRVGFPVFIPHRDIYCYVKSISVNYNIGGTATMTVTCDSVRRRVLVLTEQTSGSGTSQQTFSAYTPAPNLVYQWTKNNPPQLQTSPYQSPNGQAKATQQSSTANTGTIGGVSSNRKNPTDLRGVAQSQPNSQKNPDGTVPAPTPEQLKVYSLRSQILANKTGNQYDTPYASYIIKNDGDPKQGTIDPKTKHGYFCVNSTTPYQRSADFDYIQTLTGDPTTKSNSTIPFTDDKGYELIGPFPWGRWVDLNGAIKEFTQKGWVEQPKDLNGNRVKDLNDLQVLQNTDAFLFAGLGTPSASADPSSQLIAALDNISRLVGGSLVGAYQPQQQSTNPNSPTNFASQKSNSEPDATVIVLHYDPAKPGSFADNNLLNAAQPENRLAQQLLDSNSQINLQQLVDVLVSGDVAPPVAVQEALLAADNSAIPPAPIHQQVNADFVPVATSAKGTQKQTITKTGQSGGTQFGNRQ